MKSTKEILDSLNHLSVDADGRVIIDKAIEAITVLDEAVDILIRERDSLIKENDELILKLGQSTEEVGYRETHYWCDMCANPEHSADVFHYAKFPFDIESVNKGESATICRSCEEKVTQRLNDAKENH
jgi:hypothetical protein